MCPACGNYFYRSNVRSYNTFGATVFSDGYSHACHNPYWLTQCPKCKQFFAKEHLFEMLESVCVLPMEPHLSRWVKEKIENDKLLGHLDGYFTEEETKADFIEKAIAQGQYFPVTVPEYKKSEHKIRLHCDLWHEYNMHRKEVSDETYNELCHCIINMMEDTIYTKLLTLAELYRNVGDFEKCIELLDGVSRNDNTAKFIDGIREAALKKNKKTLVIIDGNW
jgi:hypothetical protein